MKKFNTFASPVLLICICQLLAACYTYKPIISVKEDGRINKSEIAALVVPGKVYKIKVKDGREFEIKVTAMDDENIFGFISLANASRDPNHKMRNEMVGRISIQNIQNIMLKKTNYLATTVVIIIPIIAIVLIMQAIIKDATPEPKSVSIHI